MMIRGRSRALAVGAVVALLTAVSVAAGAGGEGPVTVTAGNLKVTADGDIIPDTLPKSTFAPASFWAEGKIATVDGSHIPAAKTIIVEADKNGALTVKGYPVCKPGALQSKDTAGAMSACKSALVGEGQATAEISFPEQEPIMAKSKILAFSGGEAAGVVTLYIHAYLTVPVPASIVTIVKTEKISKGRYGTLSTATIPKIAGGSGSVKSFTLKLSKRWTYRGKKMSLITAKCPDGRLQARVMSNFADGTIAKATIVRTCTGKG
jgi:hypothetical protein